MGSRGSLIMSSGGTDTNGSTMAKQQGSYRTIKALVFDHVHRCQGNVDYEELTREVKRHFPQSKWKKTHWAWYSHQIRGGRFRSLFSEEERQNLGGTRPPASAPAVKSEAPAPDMGTAPAQGPAPKDPEVKRIGDPILDHVRFDIGLAAGDDYDLRFRLNRWIFARLQQDEIRVKRPIKKKLWDDGMQSCQACKQPFTKLKGVELHRTDASKGYSVGNCELLCRECHQELDD